MPESARARPRVEEPVAQLALLVPGEPHDLGGFVGGLLDQKERLEDRVVEVGGDVGPLLCAHPLAALARQVAHRAEPPRRKEDEEPRAHQDRTGEHADRRAAQRPDLGEQGDADQQQRAAEAGAQRDGPPPRRRRHADERRGVEALLQPRPLLVGGPAPHAEHADRAQEQRPREDAGALQAERLQRDEDREGDRPHGEDDLELATVLHDPRGDGARLARTRDERPEGHVDEEAEPCGDDRQDREDAQGPCGDAEPPREPAADAAEHRVVGAAPHRALRPARVLGGRRRRGGGKLVYGARRDP